MKLIQIDVKIVFLHGDLDDDVYMKQPKGLVIKPKHPRKRELVCGLDKDFYGLKQGL